MVELSYRFSKTNVPILSKVDLDVIGERIVLDFCPQALQTPQAIDVDRFLERYLGATIDYKPLSHCGLYLGMTIFCDSDQIPVFNHEKFCAEYIKCDAGTVIIDNDLLEPSQEHRYRFTAMHEGSHLLLHQKYFEARLLGQQKSDLGYIPYIECRVDVAEGGKSRGFSQTDRGWMEWQANHLASAILMPKSMVLKTVREAKCRRRSVNAGLEAVSDVFNVSTEAAHYRMKDLQLL